MWSWLCDIRQDICAMSKSPLSYFKPVGRDRLVKLPNPTGPLTKEIPSSIISVVKKMLQNFQRKRVYLKRKDHIPKFKAKIARYAKENGNCAAA